MTGWNERDISLKYFSLLRNYLLNQELSDVTSLTASPLCLSELSSAQNNILNNQPPSVFGKLRAELDIRDEGTATVLPAATSSEQLSDVLPDSECFLLCAPVVLLLCCAAAT